MKKFVKEAVFGLLLIFVVGSMSIFAFAIAEPSATYCEEMGYKYVYGEGKCVFPNGESCDSYAFFNGSCGREYRKNLSCSKAGESPGVAKECCEGLKVIPRIELVGGLCREIVGVYGICSDCGNGVCEKWENICNCEEDCKNSTNSNAIANASLSKSTVRVQKQNQARIRVQDNNTRIQTPSEIRTHLRNNFTFRPWQKLNESECPEGCFCRGAVVSCATENGKIINITAGKSGNILIIEINKTKVDTNLSIEIEALPNQNKTRIRAKLHEGNGTKEIKVMADEALTKVLQRLRLKNCTLEENNCTVELREISRGEVKQIMYELQLQRHARILGIFSKKMNVLTRVNAETGEIEIKKPWWAFIASEPKE